ncbi:DUF2927 domain-containing protein [Roseibium limicola]|uniref:DUF2927 domain-containing protein n=1 Tax=Roseibium limicola TaxID=2816037 RepID=A0A939J8Z5_9HYPH|nr:DUF2927 domain-containing protein [Roseibium limicola]MBO0345831.1 DUF2927 domain-containing protein [Roseibium limicola]
MFRLLSSLLLVCSLVLPACAADRIFTTEELLAGFHKTVFGLEYRRWSWQPYLVKKYMSPVRFYVHNMSEIDRRPVLDKFIRQVQIKVHGLQSSIVQDPEQANFNIYVVDRPNYLQIVREHVYKKADAKAPGRCLVRVVSDKNGIKHSTAVVVSDEGEFIFRRCMVEEVLQGLGPMNDDDSLIHSVFNDHSRHNRFTTFDQMILNMLYDDRILPGMSTEDVDRVLPRVLQQVRNRMN